MAARHTARGPPTPPSALDCDNVPSAGDDVFDPSPTFMFDDSFQGLPSEVFNQSEYGAAVRNAPQQDNSALLANSHAGATAGFHNGSLVTQMDVNQCAASRADQAAFNTSAMLAGQHASSGQSAIVQTRYDSVTERFGMITPPDAVKMESDGKLSESELHQQKSNEKSEIARKAANKRHAKEKTRRESFAQTEVNDGSEEKKEQYREKNKIAAAKCRNKKRRYNDEIETQARELEGRNKALKAELMDLRNVVIILKDQILKHSPQDCNCTKLHEYSMAQAARLLQGSSMQKLSDESSVPAFSGLSHHHGLPQPMRNVPSPTLGMPPANRRPYGSVSDHMAAVTLGGEMAATLSEASLSRKPSFVPFNGYSPHLMSGDEMHSQQSAAVSPVEANALAGPGEFQMADPNNEMFRGMQFDDSWNFVQ